MKLAVIPARGGSKRIPRKNIRPFLGVPVIAHSIRAAQATGVFDLVLVSTDDAEIAEVARAHGAEVPFVRPAEISDDHADTASVIAHAVGWARGAGDAVSEACCIYATAPFVRAQEICAGLEQLRAGNWDFVFSAVAFAAPVQRGFRMRADGSLEMLFPESFLARSQDLPPVFHDAAQFYWGRADAWVPRATLFGERSSAIVLPAHRVQDIDTEDDWARAEAMASSKLFAGA